MSLTSDSEEIDRLTEKALKLIDGDIDRATNAVIDTLMANDDPILGSLLRLHLLTEQTFDRIFATSLQHAEYLTESRLSFSQKLSLVAALGKVPNNFIECMRRVNSLRNKCAHEHGYQISINDIDRIGENLPDYAKLKSRHGKNLKMLAIRTLSSAYSPFIGAAISADAIVKLKAEGDI